MKRRIEPMKSDQSRKRKHHDLYSIIKLSTRPNIYLRVKKQSEFEFALYFKVIVNRLFIVLLWT